MSRRHKPDVQRRTRIEIMEERIALTAQPWEAVAANSHQLQQHSELLDPIADVRLEQHVQAVDGVPSVSASQEQLGITPDFRLENELSTVPSYDVQSISTQATDVNTLTGLNYVRSTYGFNGSGQTVAIIDSGIAYDHYALGRGFGTGYKVVGGWDFAENDANPYDDAPAGFHGTHVAGIVGNTSATYSGVAPGVDLVALRVFDDNGGGYFSWVESALQWVHQHRTDNRFPITTVNLSIGSDWNSSTVPNWANLEDEFAQLKADGIFISVSAGNSFSSYNTPGLSYPAASPYVVPVASVDGDGTISNFSQRNSRVIAAPGRSINSTVPDYLYGSDGVPNDFGLASGTSMAAPYVAGAATLIRQAMEFVGYTGVTEDMIYSQMQRTADDVFDKATNATYHRLNLQKAISSLMPTDEYGDSSASAYSLGTVNGNTSFRGLIGTLADIDNLKFTAAQSGAVKIEFTANNRLSVNAQLVGSSASFANNVLTFNAVAGQTYTIAINTKDGIGYYTGSIQTQADTPTAPSGFTATATSPTDVRLTWNDSTGETDYWLYQWINGQSTYIAGLNANTTSYTVQDLTPGSTNFFYLVAHNNAGITGSGWQSVVMNPSAPADFNITPLSSSDAVLSWRDSTGESDYWIYQWVNGQSTYITTLAANTTSYVAHGLSNAQTQHFYVVAHNAAGITGSGWQHVDLAAPTTPTNFTVNGISSSQINLSWADASGESEYWVYQWLNGQSTYIAGLSANTTNYTVSGLSAGQTYHFYIVAHNAVGNTGSGWQNLDFGVPTAPSSFTVTASSSTEAVLSWGDSARETDYWVYQWLNGQSTYIAGLNANTTSFRVTGLTPGQTSHFYVVAHNSMGTTGSGWQQVAMPLPSAPTTPALSISAVGISEAQLSWTDSVGETDYWVYQWLNGRTTKIASLSADATSYRVSGLAAGSTCDFYVVAHNSLGNSASSWEQVALPGGTSAASVTLGDLYGPIQIGALVNESKHPIANLLASSSSSPSNHSYFRQLGQSPSLLGTSDASRAAIDTTISPHKSDRSVETVTAKALTAVSCELPLDDQREREASESFFHDLALDGF